MNCKICNGKVTPILELGAHPLANNFVLEPREPKFPLEYGVCTHCSAFQSLEVPAKHNFDEDYRYYHYVPYGRTLSQHYSDLAKDVLDYEETQRKKVTNAVDIGSNDGTFLAALKANTMMLMDDYGVLNSTRLNVLGVEPSEKISEMANKAGIPTMNKFFDQQAANQIVNSVGFADIVSTTQVLQHIENPIGFMNAAMRVLKDDGLFVYEGRYLGSTLDCNSYDSLYHEIIILYSFRALRTLFAMVGLYPVYVAQNPIYGGSLLVFARKMIGEKISNQLVDEFKEPGIDPVDLRLFKHFAGASKTRIRRLRAYVRNLRHSGETIAAYGASSTGNTILNACGFDAADIQYVIDESPLKQGLLTPGSHIRIMPLDYLKQEPPDKILLLAWRLSGDILAKIPEYKGKVILPLPEVKVV